MVPIQIRSEDMIISYIVVSHKFNDNFDIGGTFVYGTGNAITFPQILYLGQPYIFLGMKEIL